MHPGAVYLHQGQTYRVAELDLDDGAAIVEPVRRRRVDPAPQSTPTSPSSSEDAPGGSGAAGSASGAVEVRSQVVGYRRFDTATGELLGAEELFLPPGELVTRAFWYTIEPALLRRGRHRRPAAVPGTLHAVEHAAIGLLPLFTICDRWDVGGVSTPFQAETGLPTIVIYDGYPGGAGIAELGYASADRHLQATLEVIDRLPVRRRAARRACSRPSAATATSPSTRPGAVAHARRGACTDGLIAPSCIDRPGLAGRRRGPALPTSGRSVTHR